MSAFDKHQISTFRFVRCALDAQTGVATLVYAFDQGPELVETVAVPGAPFALGGANATAVQQALQLLHLIAGVSYFKAAVPPNIAIDSYSIDAETAALVQSVYLHGLGEFAYRNGLQLHGKIRFPVAAQAAAAAPALGLRVHALVAIGGGKDSLVSIEALRHAGVDQTVSWIGGSQLIRACAERTGLPVLNIGRVLAPELFELNRQGAWNGHIPVTAVNSAILVLAALLNGVDQVVFSNERSASYGSQIPGTGEVNHQWSKGWAFEQAFGDYVQRHVAADLRYYSLLRPLSELAVARQFAKTDRYDAHFPAAIATSTSWASVRCIAGAACARSAISCFWRWHRSCPRHGWSTSSGAICSTMRRRPAATMRCWSSRTTSRSNAWAKVANRARRWQCWPAAPSGRKTQ